MSGYKRKLLSIAPSNLIAYWPLGEVDGLTIADESGHDFNGETHGFEWGQPGIGDGLTSAYFDGANDYGNVFSTGLATAFNGGEGTLFAWLNPGADDVFRVAVRLEVDSNNYVQIFEPTSAGWIVLRYCANGTVSQEWVSVASSAWIPVAITWSASADEVIVTCHPRDISASDQDVLWELKGAVINVSPEESRTLFVKYKDESGNRIGAKDVTVGDLAFEQGQATVEIAAKASGAELTFTNTGNELAIITACVVRGRKIIDFGSMDATVADAASIVDYGRRTLRLNLPAIDNLEDAEQIAQHELNRRSQPRGTVNTVKLLSHGKLGGKQHQHQLALTLGNKLALAESQIGHDAEHIIMGESHRLSAGATLFETTWYLEPAPASYPWQLGVEGRSELGNTTVLTY